MNDLMIRNASLLAGTPVDLLLRGGIVAALGVRLPPTPLPELDAAGGLLLPGLHDHHLHLNALAVYAASVDCGPQANADAAALAVSLQAGARAAPRAHWLRGVAYHESVAGDIDRDWLDAHGPQRAVRIQHRSGRLWVLNSAALESLAVSAGDPFERVDGRLTGRLYDGDAWLRARLDGAPPALGEVSAWLVSRGVTGFTEATPDNGPAAWQRLADARRRGELLQRVQLLGEERLAGLPDEAGVTPGPLKIHLLESRLPALDALERRIEQSHAHLRAVAIHCTTRTELVFALSALAAVGSLPGDRIEHASVTPPEALEEIVRLGLRVVTQPQFVHGKGDAYLQDVAAADRPWLYRLRSFLDAGVPLAGSSDAPFGGADPWLAMDAAVRRQTAAGQVLGAEEALSPEQALALYLAPLHDPGGAPRELRVGAVADLCLLDRPWNRARADLAAVGVRLAVCDGRIAHRPHG